MKHNLKVLNDVIIKYLWKQMRARILIGILNLPKNEGGVKLVSLSKKELALKIS